MAKNILGGLHRIFKKEGKMSPTVAAAAAAAAMDAAAVAKQAEQLRQEGNFCFKKDRFGAAIDAYTEAIALCPNVGIYWTNRALCHRRRNDWKRVEEDCKRAIQIDHHSVKAHYMLGLALLQREEYAEGVKELEKALDFGRGANPKGYMVEEIWLELAKAKYLEWEHESTNRSWELQSLKETCEEALKEKNLLDSSNANGYFDGDTKSNTEQLEALSRVFYKAAEDDIPTEVPDYLCCKITLDIFRDPVIAPSGFTYERAVILNHLEKVGKFDPITREPLFKSQLVPNLAIKEAVGAFLDQHGWAYRMD
ncbi:E3 ubiquitin-protein ligase CHIP-like isoform X2 [Coffea arabica]|uniref:E3 ubiquitin-protein ligase CHIP n=1 Tax=Coffea arabica TaxID=13443 RepID=A0A6P6WFZ9_COFAR|nr:E3 ubiquitin-protein ligase CHIP-like isoform X2 [Coffea arabica]